MYLLSNRRDPTRVMSRQNPKPLLHKCNSSKRLTQERERAREREWEREAKAIESFPNQRKREQLSATSRVCSALWKLRDRPVLQDGRVPSCLGWGLGRQQQGRAQDVGGRDPGQRLLCLPWADAPHGHPGCSCGPNSARVARLEKCSPLRGLGTSCQHPAAGGPRGPHPYCRDTHMSADVPLPSGEAGRPGLCSKRFPLL